jgi:phosphatidate cytidylyltransferase
MATWIRRPVKKRAVMSSLSAPGESSVLRTRVLTALAMVAALYVGTTFLPPFYFGIALAVVLIPALLEWAGLMGLHKIRDKILYLLLFYTLLGLNALLLDFKADADALNTTVVTVIMFMAAVFWLLMFYFIIKFPAAQSIWATVFQIGLMGFFSILPLWVALLQLKYMAVSGYLVLTLIALVSVVDIGAFFAGRRWGKKKLAPALSPKKSWAGFWGGLVSCALLAALLSVALDISLYSLSPGLFMSLIAAALLIAVVSVIGDLYESMLKRHQGIKDSGRSLPGHGGILDRIDSLIAAAPFFVLVMIYLLPDVAWV